MIEAVGGTPPTDAPIVSFGRTRGEEPDLSPEDERRIAEHGALFVEGFPTWKHAPGSRTPGVVTVRSALPRARDVGGQRLHGYDYAAAPRVSTSAFASYLAFRYGMPSTRLRARPRAVRPQSSASATCGRRRSSLAIVRDFNPDRAYACTQVSVRIIPLGGLGEVGKNMTVYESGGEVIVVDAGLAFPRDEHLGVDLVLPEMTYLAERPGGVRAVVLTHGHEDHVGALPYLLRVAKVKEIWATRLTLGLIKSKLDEHGLLRAAEMREADIGVPVELGPFRIEFVRMAIDSRPAALAEEGKLIVHRRPSSTTRRSTAKTDVGSFARKPRRRPRSATPRTPNARCHATERVVGEAFGRSSVANGRILISSFASNVTVQRASMSAWSAARWRSSAARCARTRTSHATSASWRYRTACC